MAKLLIFTDIHIKGDTIIGLDPVTRFKEALTHALAHHSDAQGIVLMGDLTHSGTVGEYNLLKDILVNVPLPITFMMGNHDRREAFLQVFPKARLDSSGFVQSSFDVGEWCAITLDTLDGPPYPDKHHSGMLCADRLAWLSDQLEQAKEQPVVLCTHHPLGELGLPMLDRIKLENGSDVIDLIRKHPMPVHVLAGHVHRTISGQWQGVPYTSFKSTCHQNTLNLAQQHDFMFVDQPGAYGVILSDGPNIIVHSEDYALSQQDGLSDTLS